jgi:hypothetical protein
VSTHVEAFLEGGPLDGETRVLDDRLPLWDPEVRGWDGFYILDADGAWVWTEDDDEYLWGPDDG